MLAHLGSTTAVDELTGTDEHTGTHWHSRSIEEIEKSLNTTRGIGLSVADLSDLRARSGFNVLPEAPRRSYVAIFVRQFLNPLIYLLLLAAGVAVYLGDFKDAAVILVVVILNALIGTIQEGRAENSLRSLRNLSAIKARIRRDSVESLIEAKELLPGDVVLVSAGDAIPTDLRIFNATAAMASEAALTGESVPVEKADSLLENSVALAERSNMLFAGTFLTMGRAEGIAVAIGPKNEIGKIAALTALTSAGPTPLERKIHKFGRDLVFAAVILFAAVVLVGWLQGISMTEIFMIAVSQMVSLVPEGLPVAMTVALAIGVQRMASRKTIVRRLSAVESLGSVTTICTDKTGTLTKNEMTVTAIAVAVEGATGNSEIELVNVSGVGYSPEGQLIWQSNGRAAAPNHAHDQNLQQILMACALCNDSQNVLVKEANRDSVWTVLGDPTEGALTTLASKAGLDVEALRKKWRRTFEIPFNSVTKIMVTGHVSEGAQVTYIKGAPESLFRLVGDSQQIVTFKAAAEEMAGNALRVLAIGVSDIPAADDIQVFRGRVKILGLVGQTDPPRSEVKQSIRECRVAGIRTVMVTGDHRATAIAIARELEIYRDGDLVVDGADFDTLFAKWSPNELAENLQRASVFARVVPAQKQKLIEAFQSVGHIVAMTGDGVNDAPALAMADVGVAMGITGTEVAKEASKIVIMDDRFSTIVSAISEGRLVYRNIKKLILFLFVTSLDEVVILFLALLAGFAPPLAAVHILWINLVTEGVLTINLVMEPPEGDEMMRPPVLANEPLLDRALLARIPLMVIASVVSVFGWFIWRTHQGIAHDLVQTETFTALAVSQWYNVLNCRSEAKSVFSQSFFSNRWLLIGLLGANLLHLAVVYLPSMNQFFHTVPIPIESFFAIGLVASFVLWVEEARKFLVRRRRR